MKNRQGVTVLLGILALGSILAMTSCGSTVDLTGLGNGAGNTDGTGIGPVAGFGSVIVNGVKYDDTGIDNTRSSLRRSSRGRRWSRHAASPDPPRCS